MTEFENELTRRVTELERRLALQERIEGGGGGWSLIHSETLGATAAQIDYSSIPQTYSALWLWLLTRASNNDYEDVYMYFNNDLTDSNYRSRLNDGTIDSLPAIGVTSGNTATAGAYGFIQVSIHGYASAYIHSSLALEANAPLTTNISSRRVVHRWNTAAAVNRITIKPRPAGLLSFLSGSQLLVFAH